MNKDQESFKKERKIAVIGPTQSGKTCLALGLFSTSTSDFTIETVDQNGREYLDGLKADIARGGWPDPTNRGTKKNIRFDFRKSGKDPIRVEFPDYDGERLRTDEDFARFANENFKDLDGVILLLNPGAESFQSNDPRLLADAMSQYKRVLSFLTDPNSGSKNALVALTVTAADRIAGDLKGKLETFDQSVEEISNTLTTSGFRWERFDVSITGHLKEQNVPKLARGRQNSASTPFFWILDELNWRPVRAAIFRRVRRFCYAAMALVGLGAAWFGVSLWDDNDKIGGIERECRLAMKRCRERNKPELGDLKKTRECLMDLRNLRTTFGFLDEKSVQLADDLEPEVWQLHELLLDAEIGDIAQDPEKYGGYCYRVDQIFADFVPKIKSLAEEHSRKKSGWEGQKPKFQDRYAGAQLLENVGKPLAGMVSTHGKAAFEKFIELYAELSNVETVGNSSVRKAALSSKLDARVEKEWREFEIPDFERHAKSKASAEATHDFVTRLRDWNPATTNYSSKKEELLVAVTSRVPVWRKDYEKDHLASTAKEAASSHDMAEMAKFYPERVLTNEFLSLEYIESVWNTCVSDKYEKACEDYKEEFVRNIKRRSGRPSLTDDDRANIKKKERTVGQPFRSEAAIAEIQKALVADQRKWDSDHRKICEKWIQENIVRRPKRDRTGSDGLFDAYTKERGRCREYEDLFNEIVRPAVYRQAENWLESDLEFFRAGKDDVKGRFLDKFKPLCLRICEDGKNHDPKSWAYSFAVKCVDVGRIKENGFDAVFPQVFEISAIEAKVVPETKPPSDFLGIQVGVSVTNKVLFACNDDDEERRIKCNEDAKLLWSGCEEIQVAQFTPPSLTVKASVVINWGPDRDSDYSIDFRSFDQDLSGSYTDKHDVIAKGVQYPLYLRIKLKRTAGKTIGELMAEAKKEVASEQK